MRSQGRNGTVQNNTIADNSASVKGGGLVFCDGTIENNIIRKNSAGSGGGLFACDGPIQNNLIVGNVATGHGGGIAYCDGLIRNNTVSGNSAGHGDGLAACKGTIINCIVWDGMYQSSTPSYTCGWGGGVGNITSDPKFADPDGPDNNPATYENNDYRLSSNSPCIDKGRNGPWMAGTVDLDGNNRIFGISSLSVDMGAYEYGSFPFRVVEVKAKTGGAIQLTWNSRPGDSYDLWSVPKLLGAPVWTHEATVQSQGQTTSWTDTKPLGGAKFYQIELK